MAPVLAPVELESSTRIKHQRPIGAAPAGLQLGLFGLPLARTQNLQLFRKSRHSPTLKNQRSSAFAVRFSLSGLSTSSRTDSDRFTINGSSLPSRQKS